MSARTKTSLLIAMILLPILLIGRIPYLVGSILVIAMCLYEVIKIKKINLYIMIPLISLTLLTTFYDYKNVETGIFNYPVFYLVLLSLTLYTISVWKEGFTVEDVNFLVVMIFILSVFGRSLIYVRGLNGNANVFLYVLATTMGVDVFAYLIGKKYGKTKLNEHVSPKKTIEGSIGGIVGGLVLGVIVGTIFPIFTNENTTPFLGLAVTTSFSLIDFLKVIILSLLLTITSQMGDLMFSLIKRNYKIKDFSNFLPGHGGVLDRIDSISFNIIVVTFLHMFLMSF